MRGYTSALLLSDALAGLTVAMVAIPLCIAIASGTKPAKGLVTAILGGALISPRGGSRVQIGGPTGTFILVVYGVISTHGYDGLVQAMLMAGVILIAAGWLRVVELIAYVPEAAVNGLTIGIAITIAFSQLGDLLGLDRCGVPAEIFARAPAIWAARADRSAGAGHGPGHAGADRCAAARLPALSWTGGGGGRSLGRGCAGGGAGGNDCRPLRRIAARVAVAADPADRARSPDCPAAPGADHRLPCRGRIAALGDRG
jgi:hypothetical protein